MHKFAIDAAVSLTAVGVLIYLLDPKTTLAFGVMWMAHVWLGHND